MMDPLIKAAVGVVANMLPEIVAWVMRSLQGGRDPQQDLETLMHGAEEAARLAEQRKFGGDDA